ncbi:Hypothetical_protein [Hexamita inflata]|uniref:Hypothetical_protein n=1 Tax=Hexamita inflata TaxID=28002 RepID=A0AA86U3D0_9EUKA|nr:Hypothetical protein HINF_LOCUS25936 [Hexamita inflata]
MMNNVDSNQITFNNISVVIGNNSYMPACNSIVSNSSSSNVFGGFITTLTNTNVLLNTLIYDYYQTYSTKYSEQSAFMFGNVDKTNDIQISNLCQFVLVNVAKNYLGCFGLVGIILGNISLKQSKLQIILNNGTLEQVGLIGYQQSRAAFSDLHIQLCFNANSDSYGKIGIFGNVCKSISTFKNVLLNNSIISAQYSTGGFFGQFLSSDIQIQDVCVCFSNISASKSSAAALVGSSSGVSAISAIQLELKSIRINSNTWGGYIVGANQGQTTFKVQGKTTGANFVNGVSQTNCAAFTQNWPQQCV